MRSTEEMDYPVQISLVYPSEMSVTSITIRLYSLPHSDVEGRSIEAFSVFKKGIRPEWEDISNRTGSDLTCR